MTDFIEPFCGSFEIVLTLAEGRSPYLRRAQALYADPERLLAFRRRGMGRDFSWAASARKYERLFTRLL